ncbi:MAG TPA: VanZ family protein [Rhizomicrobium sp.]|jgi:VanZ family protein|nr:VanZ family protein [Rhizomicrobium sp.]
MTSAHNRVDRGLLLVLVGIMAVIVHGSLYPYAFRIPLGSENAFDALVGSWPGARASYVDVLANVLLYMPLGFFGVQTLRIPLRLMVVTLFGLTLCTGMELAQFYDEGRVTSIFDVFSNTLGTGLGGVAGIAAGAEWHQAFFRERSGNSIPVLLLVALLGYRLYPYVPVTDLHKYWHALKPVVLQPSFAPLMIYHYFSLWLVVCYLVAQVAGRRLSTSSIFLIAAFILGAKTAIVDLVVTMPELVGMLSAFAVWFAVLNRSRVAAPVIGVLFCGMIVAFRLIPFDFDTLARSFIWLPFRGYMTGSPGANIASFFEKFFLYGSLIWIGCGAGLRTWAATGATVGLLFVTSLAETHLPGRSAEITDAVMALLIGVIFATMIAQRDEPTEGRLVRATKV